MSSADIVKDRSVRDRTSLERFGDSRDESRRRRRQMGDESRAIRGEWRSEVQQERSGKR